MQPIPHSRRYQKPQMQNGRSSGQRYSGPSLAASREDRIGASHNSDSSTGWTVFSVILGLTGLFLTAAYTVSSYQFWLGAIALWSGGVAFANRRSKPQA